MLNTDYYFPTPIWWTDTQIDNSKLLDYCYQLRESDPKGRHISNNGGWQSDEIDVNDISELVDCVMTTAPKTLVDYGFDLDKTSLFFGNAWVNINKGKDTNQIHLHHGSYLSGVYYVKATPQSGNIFFYKDFNQSFITSSFAKIVNNTSISGGVCYYPPKTGRVIMFPSNLLHSVDASSDDEDRISIAFNLGIRYE
jgi:uncharacterized protein (TIGR02466 family)